MSMSTWREPAIDHDTPIPAGIEDRRKKYGHGPHNPSPWLKFMGKLQVGDSFLVENKRLQAVTNSAKKLGIDVYHQAEGPREPWSWNVRVWRIK